MALLLASPYPDVGHWKNIGQGPGGTSIIACMGGCAVQSPGCPKGMDQTVAVVTGVVKYGETAPILRGGGSSFGGFLPRVISKLLK